MIPALSKRMIARIFSGAVTRGGVKSGNGVQQPQDKMSYTEFVWFLLSEEDKNHPTAIEYWFRCGIKFYLDSRDNVFTCDQPTDAWTSTATDTCRCTS